MAKQHVNRLGHTRHTLSALEKFRLQQYLTLHYTEFGLTDIEFAKKAEEELKVPVSAAQVSYFRKEFNIPTNYQERSGTSKGWQLELIKRVETLETQVATLLRERNGKGPH